MNTNDLNNLELKKIYKLMSEVKKETNINDIELDNLYQNLSNYLQSYQKFETLIDMRKMLDSDKEAFKAVNQIFSVISNLYFLDEKKDMKVSNSQKEFILKFTKGYSTILIDYYNAINSYFSDYECVQDGFLQILESPLFLVYDKSLRTVLLNNLENLKLSNNMYKDEYEQHQMFDFQKEKSLTYYAITMSQSLVEDLNVIKNSNNMSENKDFDLQQSALYNVLNMWFPDDKKCALKKFVEVKDFFTDYFIYRFMKNLNGDNSNRKIFYQAAALENVLKKTKVYDTDNNNCLTAVLDFADFAFENGNLKTHIMEIKQNVNHSFLTENNFHAPKSYLLHLCYKDVNFENQLKVDKLLNVDRRELEKYGIKFIQIHMSSSSEFLKTITFEMDEKSERLNYPNVLSDIIIETVKIEYVDNGTPLIEEYKSKIREIELLKQIESLEKDSNNKLSIKRKI